MVFPHTYRNEHMETITTSYSYGKWFAEYSSTKISISQDLRRVLKLIDAREKKYRQRFATIVAFKTISTDRKYIKDIYDMKSYIESWFNRLGIKNESFDIGETEYNGESLLLPPVILGRLRVNAPRLTICVYMYLDVMEPNIAEWDTDPWTLTEKDGKFYGVGAASSKGIFLCWMNAIESMLMERVDPPINIRFVIEAAHCMDSPNLMKFLVSKKQDFFYDVDYIVCCLSQWLGNKFPCICYGTVGHLYFTMTGQKIEGSKTEVEDDLKKIFATIVDDEKRILIPHFNDYVDQVTPDEERLYNAIRNFNLEEVRPYVPPYKQKWDKVRLLMHYWRQPTLTVHEAQKCICEVNDTTIVRQDFTVKFVQRQIMEKCISSINSHIKNKVKEFEIQNKIDVQLAASVKHWIENINSPLYQAARRATIQIYKEEPDMIREDRSRVILSILKMVFEKPLLVLPIVTKDNNKFAPNEFITRKNFMEGTKLIAAFIMQLGEIGRANKSKK